MALDGGMVVEIFDQMGELRLRYLIRTDRMVEPTNKPVESSIIPLPFTIQHRSRRYA
jgi:hypothetical protein